MRNLDNIESLLALNPDFVGFIFYKKSKRFVREFPNIIFPKGIKKIGVFVNESIRELLRTIDKHQLDGVQLHGNESPEFCDELVQVLGNKKKSVTIIKAFSVDEEFDFDFTTPFNRSCDFFLFDTKGKDYGGNGVKFNWKILENYNGETLFLLSGGIAKQDVHEIKNFGHKSFWGIDINSGFEIEPGLKNINEIKEFKLNLS